MKFFHISDLHLGRQLYGYSLLEDQEYVLRQVLSYAETLRPDAILICGDIYDKTVPSQEAVSLFDWFLTEIAGIVPRIPVLIISGNHDSPERLTFADKILKEQQIYLAGKLPDTTQEHLTKVTFRDSWGELDVWMLPFLKPGYVRKLRGQEPDSYQAAVEQILDREYLDESRRNVLMSHQFYVSSAGMPERSDSEILVVGGLDQVDVSCISRFDYGALGHIHRAQTVGAPGFRYCGTLLKYSVSEWKQKKTLTVVELREKGTLPLITEMPLEPLRDVKAVQGELEDILADMEGSLCLDYVSVTLTDRKPPYRPKERLETVFPYILEVRMEDSAVEEAAAELEEEWETADPAEIFDRFFARMNGRRMDEEEKAVLDEICREVQEEL